MQIEVGTTLSTLNKSMFNIIVSNTQKIILKKQHKQKTATESLFSVDKQIIKPKTSVYDKLERPDDFDQVELPENDAAKLISLCILSLYPRLAQES